MTNKRYNRVGWAWLEGAAVIGAMSLVGAACAKDEPVPQARNVVLFVADGLRHGIVTQESAPTLWRFMHDGVAFANSHSLFPTFTTANASAMATGHYLGDTGDFSNTIYTGPTALPAAAGNITPFLESDPVIRDADTQFGGNYLNEETLLQMARAKGMQTAAIGKLGPTFIQDHVRDDDKNPSAFPQLVIDDKTGTADGVPLPKAVQDALEGPSIGLGSKTPSRGWNGDSGTAVRPGTLSANIVQQAYFISAATNVVLPMFKSNGKSFLMVYWSRDPDGTQHNQGDSLLQLTPGINGPTSLAAIRNMDNNLSTLLSALKAQGLDSTTDVIVTSDHGFSTVAKQSATSPAAKATYSDVPATLLPPGFLAIDLATALNLPLFDPAAKAPAPVASGTHTLQSSGLIGSDPAHPSVIVASNGGSDLIYLPGDDAKSMVGKVVDALLEQDYVSGIFVNDGLGSIPGTLPMSAINLIGSAATPKPAIVVNFRSFHVTSPACPTWLTCVVEVADASQQQGQGMHGSFSRADTFNFTAAGGPSFKRGYTDKMPVSNADVGQTIAKLLGLTPSKTSSGSLFGRPFQEAMVGGREKKVAHKHISSTPSSNGLKTVLYFDQVGDTKYFKVAGFPGRTAGLTADGKVDHLADGPAK
jgi:hypothetical protein